jgi:hypothetical protein
LAFHTDEGTHERQAIVVDALAPLDRQLELLDSQIERLTAHA